MLIRLGLNPSLLGLGLGLGLGLELGLGLGKFSLLV